MSEVKDEDVLVDGEHAFTVRWSAFADEDAATIEFARCASAFAAAHRTHTLASSEFRHWRAHAYVRLIKEDPKAGEWKARAVVEAQPGYEEHKQRLARVEHALHVLRAACVFFAMRIGVDISTPIVVSEDAGDG